MHPLCSRRKQTNGLEYSLTLTIPRIRWACTLPGRRQHFRILVADHNHPLWTYMLIQLCPLTVSLTWAVNYTHLAALTLRYSEWYWYCLECDGSPIQCLATFEVECPDKNAALQCSGTVGPTIWCRNMDNAEIRHAENRGLPHVLPAPHSWDTLVWLHLECRSCRSNTWRDHRHTSRLQRRRLALFGHVRTCSDMFVDFRIPFEPMLPSVCA